MANKQNSKKITIANIVSIVGVVLLLVFTFLGQAYKSGGEITVSLLISIVVAAWISLLLWFMIKAKGAENDLKKWKVAECATGVVYVISAILSLWGMMQFFVVNSTKDDIQDLAKTDLAKIDNMINDFKSFENEAISNTYLGLKDALAHNSSCDHTLKTFMNEKGITSNESVNVFRNVQEFKLCSDVEGNFYEVYNEYAEEKLKIEKTIDRWNILLIPFAAENIEKLAAQMGATLTAISAEGAETLPEIKTVVATRRGVTKYTLGEGQKKEFVIDAEEFQFRNAMKEAQGFNVIAIVCTLFIHVLIIFNYVVAYRTNTLSIKNSEEDGGRILNLK